MSQPFKEHGETRIIDCSLPSIVHLQMQGPWNAELIAHSDRLIDGQKALLDENQAWALLVEVVGSALCTQEALQAMHLHASLAQRRVATAWVLAPSVEGHRIMAFMLRETYAHLHGAMDIFADCPTALLWLQSQLAKTGAP